MRDYSGITNSAESKWQIMSLIWSGKESLDTNIFFKVNLITAFQNLVDDENRRIIQGMMTPSSKC